MKNNNPIGFFDSGVGGLSIWKEVNQLLPNESTIYLADSINAPYGEKSKQQIIDFSIKNTEFLLAKNCKMIVVACNTATTNAISILREKFDVPFVGIEPATKPAAIYSKTGVIGVLATQGTLTSDLFIETSKKYKKDTHILEAKGTGLVHLIEKGEIEKTKPILKDLLAPLIEQNIDYLVLGCTHYPFLKPILKTLLPSSIQVIDSGNAVAKRTSYLLLEHQLSCSFNNHTTNKFITTGNQAVLDQMLFKL